MNYLDRITANRIQSGNVKAFETLINTFKSRIFSYCLRMLNDYHLAEDMSQEIFIKVYKNINHYDGKKASLSTWIYTIAHNTCLNHLRDWHNQPAPTRNSEYYENCFIAKDQYSLLNEKISLLRALNTLSPDERDIVIMKDYLDLKYSEIGQITSLPTGTVKSRLHGIRKKLRNILSEGEPNE